MNLVGAKVSRERTAQGLTQEALTARCQLAGLQIERGTLAKIEAGIRQVTDIEVIGLATALRVPVATLFPTPAPPIGRAEFEEG